MKKVLFIPLWIAVCFQGSFATIYGNARVLEAANAIEFHMNDLTAKYLLYLDFPAKGELPLFIKRDQDALSKRFQEIAITSNDSQTKKILAFFGRQKTRITEIMTQKHPSDSSGRELLTMSEHFSDRLAVIRKHHHYDFEIDDKILDQTEKARGRLPGIAKYYYAYFRWEKDTGILEKMQRSIVGFSEAITPIKTYAYPKDDDARKRKQLLAIWQTLKPYLDTEKNAKALPMVTDVALTQMGTLLHELGSDHRQNR